MSDHISEASYNLYKHYVALKNHFTTDHYDYFKYGGNLNFKVSSMQLRKDQIYFSQVSKRRNAEEYVFANILNDPNVYIGDIARDKTKADEVFIDWERRMQSLSYVFKEDMKKLLDDFDANFAVPEDGGHPPLLRLLLRKKICIETVAILDMILSFMGMWDRKMKDDPVWKPRSVKIRKYKPFLEIDLPKFKKIVKDRFL